MKAFAQALLLSAVLSSQTAEAKKFKTFEANAFITPKRDTPNSVEPYLVQNFANYHHRAHQDLAHANAVTGHDVYRTVVTAGAEDTTTHIVSTKEVDNYFNLQITTRLYFGSQQEPHDLIIDTGSAWTWLQTKDCWSCGSHIDYNPHDSETWKDLEEADGHMMAAGYGSGAVFGFAGTEKVCLSPNEGCADSHRMAAITAETGLDTIVGDGILGLSLEPLSDMPKLFMDSLKEQGTIDQRMFSILVGLDHNLPSKLMVGGYDLAKYAKGPIQWHDTVQPQKTWYLNWTGVNFGETALELEPTVLLPDTGTSFISLPEKTMNNLLDIMHTVYGTGKPKLYPNGLWGAHCTVEQYDAMPDLRFIIDSTAYVISKHQYLINRNGHCVLQIAPTGDTGKAYLGINFFENYYGVFDMDNKKVGFAESVFSDLSEHQSSAHTNQILLNMSSYQKTEYFMEAVGMQHGPETLIASMMAFSLICGIVIASFCLSKSDEISQTKAARKALAQTLNQANGYNKGITYLAPSEGALGLDNDMFEVPLNDDQSYERKDDSYRQKQLNFSDEENENDLDAQQRLSVIAEDEGEYSFDVDN